ncbi:MAG TPA: hypothetical protein VKA60_11660 [Blastocatellia bacterium]|nr:hypothetical protein [Blastocatellia bacterium]
MNAFRLTVGLLAAGSLILFLAAQIHTGKALAQGGGKYQLDGGWSLEGTPAAGSPIPPFKALATFSVGGGVVETVLLPPVVTPAHGAWEQTANHEFAFAVVHHLVDQNGHLTGTVKAKSIVTLTSRDEFVGRFEGTFFDPQGNAVFPVNGTERGTRIKVE